MKKKHILRLKEKCLDLMHEADRINQLRDDIENIMIKSCDHKLFDGRSAFYAPLFCGTMCIFCGVDAPEGHTEFLMAEDIGEILKEETKN